MALNPLACAACPVRDRAACSALNEEDRDELARLGQHRTLRRGETLFASGDDSLACATLISGALKISSFGQDGTERILSLVHPAGFVGEMFAPVAHHDVILPVALRREQILLEGLAEHEREVLIDLMRRMHANLAAMNEFDHAAQNVSPGTSAD